MLRVATAICCESPALDLFATTRRDVFKLFRSATHTSVPLAAQVQTVLKSSATPPPPPPTADSSSSPSTPPPACGGPAPPPPPPPPPRRSWTVAAAAAALTASVGGVYFYRKLIDDEGSEPRRLTVSVVQTPPKDEEPDLYPREGSRLPAHVQYLLVGGGTAAFAAMRAIRSARPDARVLMVSEERALPYMRPPLSKELWREPELAARALRADTLTFRQWNGKRRSVVYEPAAFYAPLELMAEEVQEGAETGTGRVGGASVARGWRVTRLDVAKHEAELVAPGQQPVLLRYDKCLLATGVSARRLEALRDVAAAGKSLALRSLRDAARIAAALDEPSVKRVAVVGGGFLASELSAALADRLRDSGRTVVQVVAEGAPMAAVLPEYLARDAARRLSELGVTLIPAEEVTKGSIQDGRVHMTLSSGSHLDADLVVECVGSETDPALAAASGLETHPQLGGLLVNAELQARSDVYAAGDAACFYDVVLGRRRVEHHDHAVVSGRLAGENMAALGQPKHYQHQSMFWSDLGPQLGYEAIGIIDSRLPTVGIFSADAVVETGAVTELEKEADKTTEDKQTTVARAVTAAAAAAAAAAAPGTRRYERGVVFYLRERRVVGVLLWNLFNRMHVARQVLAHGEFDDLFEVAKLFSPHEED